MADMFYENALLRNLISFPNSFLRLSIILDDNGLFLF